MGRISEYINGSRGRSVYLDSAPAAMSAGVNDVEITGIIENQAMFERLMTHEPGFDLNTRKVIRKALQLARKNLSNDAKSYIKNDPRRAAKAVKHTVYKELFGGNLSILNKRKAGAPGNYQKPRTLRPGQRGGNRRKVSDTSRTAKIDSYYGSDRGFILRFLNAGTGNRQTRYGNRGALRQTDWFAHTAPWQMETAAENVANAINEYIKQQSNG